MGWMCGQAGKVTWRVAARGTPPLCTLSSGGLTGGTGDTAPALRSPLEVPPPSSPASRTEAPPGRCPGRWNSLPALTLEIGGVINSKICETP